MKTSALSKSLSLIVLTAAASGCGGAQLKAKDDQIAFLNSRTTALSSIVEARTARVADLEKAQRELQGQVTDHEAKLAAAQSRIDSLVKSNRDLEASLKANTGELQTTVREVIKEKDELSRQLADSRKAKIAASRAAEDFQAQLKSLSAETAKINGELARAKAELTAAKTDRDRVAREASSRLDKTRSDMRGLADALKDELAAGKVSIHQAGETIEVSLQESLLFKTQQVQLLEPGKALLARVAPVVAALSDRRIRIEGHTDDSPIGWRWEHLIGGSSSNWELSATQAAVAARYLQDSGMDAGRITAAGYSSSRPVASNDAPAGKAANRRLVLVLEPLASQRP